MSASRGRPKVRLRISRAARVSPSFARATSARTMAAISSGVTVRSSARRSRATRRASGLPGPPRQPFAKRPVAGSRPSAPFGDGVAVLRVRPPCRPRRHGKGRKHSPGSSPECWLVPPSAASATPLPARPARRPLGPFPASQYNGEYNRPGPAQRRPLSHKYLRLPVVGFDSRRLQSPFTARGERRLPPRSGFSREAGRCPRSEPRP